MTDPADNVTSFHRPRREAERPGGGNGNGYDKRLRDLEQTVARIDERVQHLATREDLERMQKNLHKWISSSLIAALIAIALALLRTFIDSG